MLLLLGIPVFVWMKWRQRREPLPADFDLDRAIFSRHHVPSARPPAGKPRDPVERTLVGLD
jgi:hypothetical protein